MRLLIAVVICLGVTSLGMGAEPSYREPYNDAVDRGLAFLARSQGTDGAWTRDGAFTGVQAGKDPAITSLCVMAFLSAGHVPGEGPYGKTVENGIKFVLAQQQPNGLFADKYHKQWEMYHHGICTLMLSEAVGMLPDRAAAKALRKQLEPAVELVLKAQLKKGEDRGGWRYNVVYVDSDLSVTGWQLMALRAAKNVGCDIPAEPIEQAVAYIKRCYDPMTGGYRYQRNGGVTIPCTGTGILALELTGKDHHRSPEALKAGAFLLKYPLDPNKQHFFYGVYYTSQAMFQLGDNYWNVYRKNLHDLLLRQKPPRDVGCWSDGQGIAFGPNYATAMAILALTVDYRFLPIYQRSEEPSEKSETNPAP